MIIDTVRRLRRKLSGPQRHAWPGFHQRGRAICNNSLQVPIGRADEAILADLQRFVLDPAVVGRVIDLALDQLRPSADAGTEHERLDRELRTLDRESPI